MICPRIVYHTLIDVCFVVVLVLFFFFFFFFVVVVCFLLLLLFLFICCCFFFCCFVFLVRGWVVVFVWVFFVFFFFFFFHITSFNLVLGFDMIVSVPECTYNIFTLHTYWVWQNVGTYNILRKHACSNILKISPPKTESFQIKNSDIFSYFCSKHRLWVLVRTA